MLNAVKPGPSKCTDFFPSPSKHRIFYNLSGDPFHNPKAVLSWCRLSRTFLQDECRSPWTPQSSSDKGRLRGTGVFVEMFKHRKKWGRFAGYLPAFSRVGFPFGKKWLTVGYSKPFKQCHKTNLLILITQLLIWRCSYEQHIKMHEIHEWIWCKMLIRYHLLATHWLMASSFTRLSLR